MSIQKSFSKMTSKLSLKDGEELTKKVKREGYFKERTINMQSPAGQRKQVNCGNYNGLTGLEYRVGRVKYWQMRG